MGTCTGLMHVHNMSSMGKNTGNTFSWQATPQTYGIQISRHIYKPGAFLKCLSYLVCGIQTLATYSLTGPSVNV